MAVDPSQPYDRIRELYLYEDRALLTAIRRGDRREATRITNLILVHIYSAGEERSELLKGLLLELVVMMSRAAAGQTPVLRVSFVKVLELLRPLWLTLALGEDLLSEWQKNQLVRRFYKQMGRCVSAPRRARSCPRAVRQPVSGWPRLLRNESVEAPLHFQLL